MALKCRVRKLRNAYRIHRSFFFFGLKPLQPDTPLTEGKPAKRSHFGSRNDPARVTRKFCIPCCAFLPWVGLGRLTELSMFVE